MKALNARGAHQHPTSDGVFLIRPSQSRPGYYALAVIYQAKIFQCLIEYRPPATDKQPGWSNFL
jgi:hypothetical protein